MYYNRQNLIILGTLFGCFDMYQNQFSVHTSTNSKGKGGLLMYLKMAWRNIKRQPSKSSIILLTVTTGVFVLLIAFSCINGISRNFTNLVIGTMAGDLSVAPSDEGTFKIDDNTIDKLRAIDGIDCVSRRMTANGILSTGSTSSTVMLIGIEPENEKELVTNFSNREGKLLIGSGSVAVNKVTAKKLGIHKDDKITITCVSTSGKQCKKSFNVSCVYEGTATNAAIELWVLMPRTNLNSLLEADGSTASTIKLFAKNGADVSAIAKQADRIVSQSNDKLKVTPWYDSEANQFMTAPHIYTGILLGFSVVLFVLVGVGVFSVIITSILQQTRDIGTLRAIGMNQAQIFSIFALEVLIIVSAAALLGCAVGGIAVAILGQVTIKAANDAMVFSFGGRYLSPILYADNFTMVAGIAVSISLIAVVLPLIKLVKVNIINCLRV